MRTRKMRTRKIRTRKMRTRKMRTRKMQAGGIIVSSLKKSTQTKIIALLGKKRGKLLKEAVDGIDVGTSKPTKTTVKDDKFIVNILGQYDKNLKEYYLTEMSQVRHTTYLRLLQENNFDKDKGIYEKAFERLAQRKIDSGGGGAIRVVLASRVRMDREGENIDPTGKMFIEYYQSVAEEEGEEEEAPAFPETKEEFLKEYQESIDKLGEHKELFTDELNEYDGELKDFIDKELPIKLPGINSFVYNDLHHLDKKMKELNHGKETLTEFFRDMIPDDE